MKHLGIGFAALMGVFAITTSSAFAACVGTGTFSTCTDDSGNSYSVQRFGNMTNVQGMGANGQTWNQSSQTVGNQTFTNGTAANGNSWNENQLHLGNGNSSISGTNSSGQPYNYFCTRATGCN
jgi:hypothetical protein